MKILITGASGFVGSFLLNQLLEESKHEVALLLRNPLKSWRIKPLLKDVFLIKGSLDDPQSYQSKLNAFKPDVLVHLAWDGVEGKDRNDSVQWKNVFNMLKLMEIANSAGVHTFVGLGSQAEYGLVSAQIDETRETKPTSLYGASKLAASSIGQMQANIYDMRFSWLRLFSSYGPMDHPNWLIPYLINSLLDGRSPNVTLAEQVWDYIHVRDVASAIGAIIDTDTASGVFNLGSGRAVSLKLIIEKIRDIINPLAIVNFGAIPYREDQVMHLEANIDLLSKETDWKPIVLLDNGLLETVDWWKSLK